ncbi:hypothetical protein BUALT_Bualt04G0134500 [Buddleja alternifolia]|uniref:Protein SPIRAL1-like 3 n=1 Tax=Buddleja alternifolia TaxID=168488 RepID=A0AAV6XQT2_9LAMI|nr:hypothetical protein BUALT_Bualt04G0134500 [Buddleja alternifolia]
MGRRGVSAGGGQSSLGYLFGGGEEAPTNSRAAQKAPIAEPSSKPADASPPVDNSKQTPAGVPGSKTNNYFRADGQNCGNFLTERPSTKVHAAPGGGSSLNYLFGGDSSK